MVVGRFGVVTLDAEMRVAVLSRHSKIDWGKDRML